jgi:hypothetical protein
LLDLKKLGSIKTVNRFCKKRREREREEREREEKKREEREKKRERV